MILKDVDLNYMRYRMRKHGRTKRIRVMHILHSIYMRFNNNEEISEDLDKHH